MTAAELAIQVRGAVAIEAAAFWNSQPGGMGEDDRIEEIWAVDLAVMDGTEEPATVGRRVWIGIEPTGNGRTASSRGGDDCDVAIRVVVFERFEDAGGPTKAWGDGLFRFTHELRNRLSDAERNDWEPPLGDFPPESSEVDFDFDPDQWSVLKTWVSAFVVVYRGEVGNE